MRNIRPGLMIGVTTCVLFLAACNTDGVTLGAGSGGGLSVAGAAPAPSSSGSSGAGSTSTGSGSGGVVPAAAGLGSGAVTVTAAGSTLATPPLLNTPVTTGLTSATNGLVAPLVTTGNAVLTPVANATQPLTSALPLNANIANTSMGGAPTQPIGVSILSSTPATGSLASANLLSAGQTASVNLTPTLSTLTGGAVKGSLANATVANHTLVTGDAPLVGASVLSKTQNNGSLISVGAVSAGQPLNLSLGGKQLLPVKQ